MAANIRSVLEREGLVKVALITFLALLLQLPIMQIESLVTERAQTREQAVREISRMAGGDQTVFGPSLTIPYLSRHRSIDGSEQQEIKLATLFPDQLRVTAATTVEGRYRGIFQVPTFVSKVKLEGTFLPSSLAKKEIKLQDAQLDKASFTLGVTSLKALRDQVRAEIGGQTVELRPWLAERAIGGDGLTAPLGTIGEAPISFSCTLEIGGSGGVYFVPTGRDSRVTVTSNWSEPSFQGSVLPVSREVNGDGFTVTWNVPEFGGAFERPLLEDELSNVKIDEAKIGVQLMAGMDAHRMTERALKYELLFISLILLSFYLFELFARLPIHPIQYLLVGAAVTLFYLLLLSLAEHTGFTPAYLIATAVVTALVTAYSRAVLRAAARAWIVAALMGSMYGFLYTLLIEQDYSLLLGSTGLTIILGVLMYLTRGLEARGPEVNGETEGAA